MSEIRVGAMTYLLSSSGSVLTAIIKGAITDSDRKSLEQCFQEIKSAKEAAVQLDLSQVPTMTSQYIGQLILLFRHLHAQQRELKIKGIHEMLFSLFTAISLHEILPIEK